MCLGLAEADLNNDIPLLSCSKALKQPTSWCMWPTKINSSQSIYSVLSGPKFIKLFSCSTQLRTIVGFFIFINREIFHAQLCLPRTNLQLLVIWDLLAGQISCSWKREKSFITSRLGPAVQQDNIWALIRSYGCANQSRSEELHVW